MCCKFHQCKKLNCYQGRQEDARVSENFPWGPYDVIIVKRDRVAMFYNILRTIRSYTFFILS
jgi:hypothetical protein